MKITDLRCSRVFVGEHVDTIPGNSTPADEQLLKYLGVKPSDSQYESLKKPTTHKRVVLEHTLGQFYVITLNSKFYKAEV